MSNAVQKPGEKSKLVHRPASRQLDKLRVAVIAEDLRLPLDEGAKKTAFNIIRSLRNIGVEVIVFTRSKNPLLKDAFPLPGNKLLFSYQFSLTLRAPSPDVILYFPASSATFGAFTRAAVLKALSLGIPVALFNLQRRQLPAIARYLGIHRSVKVVFTQSSASAEALQSFGCKTVLLPAGVDCAIFQPAGEKEKLFLRSKYGFHAADRIILHVGHCKRDRNVAVLSRLAALGYRVILIASTSTVIEPDLLNELRQSGVTVITGFIEKVQHFYQMADCYVFPVLLATSAIDAPLSVLEAMACNLPVVTTRFGALPSLFRSGNGLFYVNTEEEIAGMVKQAVEEQDCRTYEMVSAYSWDNAARTILETLHAAGSL